MIMFVGMTEMSMMIAKLPVFYKQRDLLFFPAWAYGLPNWILKVPLAFIEVAVWAANGLFRFIGAAGRIMIIASTFGAFVLLFMYALGGFILSRHQVKKWWIWGYWSSPLMYAQNAIVVNELLGNSWSKILPNATKPLGLTVLKSRGFFTQAYWYWIGIGASLGYIAIFNICNVLALTFLKLYRKHQAMLPDDYENIETENVKAVFDQAIKVVLQPPKQKKKKKSKAQKT
ncbi:hypothetical protein Droror1_Dr00024560 [Drosera rotundifolia]